MLFNLFINAINEYTRSTIINAWNRKVQSAISIFGLVVLIHLAIGWFGAEARPTALTEVPIREHRDQQLSDETQVWRVTL